MRAKTYTLTGATKVGLAEAAEKIGAAIGKPVKYVPVPVPQMIEMMAKMGADDYRQVTLRDYMDRVFRRLAELNHDHVQRHYRQRTARLRCVRRRTSPPRSLAE